VVVVDFSGGLAVVRAQDPPGVLQEATLAGDGGGEEQGVQRRAVEPFSRVGSGSRGEQRGAAQLRGGVFALPIGTRPQVTSARYWTLLGFDLAMRARNAVRRPPFVMYYLTGRLPALRADLTAAGFSVTAVPLTAPGPDGGQGLLLLAAKPAA
jgi:hypothetical protein